MSRSVWLMVLIMVVFFVSIAGIFMLADAVAPKPKDATEPQIIADPAAPSQTVVEEDEAEQSQSQAIAAEKQVIQVASMQEAMKITGLKSADLKIVNIEATEWSDSSFGCPKDGYVYMQVITPGYLVIVKSAEEQLEFHTDTRDNVVLCRTTQL